MLSFVLVLALALVGRVGRCDVGLGRGAWGMSCGISHDA